MAGIPGANPGGGVAGSSEGSTAIDGATDGSSPASAAGAASAGSSSTGAIAGSATATAIAIAGRGGAPPCGKLTLSNHDAGSLLSPRSIGTLVAGRGSGVSGRGCVRGSPSAGVRRIVSLHSSPEAVRVCSGSSSVARRRISPDTARDSAGSSTITAGGAGGGSSMISADGTPSGPDDERIGAGSAAAASLAPSSPAAARDSAGSSGATVSDSLPSCARTVRLGGVSYGIAGTVIDGGEGRPGAARGARRAGNG
jgi:hypothetical protein